MSGDELARVVKTLRSISRIATDGNPSIATEAADLLEATAARLAVVERALDTKYLFLRKCDDGKWCGVAVGNVVAGKGEMLDCCFRDTEDACRDWFRETFNVPIGETVYHGPN